MAQIVQMTNEQLQQLLETVKTAATTVTASQPQTKSKRNFDSCSLFNGERDHEVVESFINSVETYKDVEGISDEDALKSISLLFYDLAATWWQGVRKEAKCWADVPRLLREHFSPSKPAYQIYMEIFAKRQDEKTAIDTFVCKQRALLAQLPDQRHDEETEIDFIYGLLNIKYRKYIARHEIKTFRDLLEKGRMIEHNNMELEANQQQQNGKNGREFRKAKRCSNCNYRGHTYRECRKRKNYEQDGEQYGQAKRGRNENIEVDKNYEG